MATASRRTLTGIAFLVGGVLLALAAVLGIAPQPAPDIARFVAVLADLAVAGAFVLLAFDTVTQPARVAAIVAASGWVLFALGELAGLPGELGTVAALAAAGGALVTAILLRTGSELGPTAGLVLLIATALYAVLILFRILGADLQGVGLLLMLLFAAGLVIVGILLLPRSRRSAPVSPAS